jgi:hypothetical protein
MECTGRAVCARVACRQPSLTTYLAFIAAVAATAKFPCADRRHPQRREACTFYSQNCPLIATSPLPLERRTRLLVGVTAEALRRGGNAEPAVPTPTRVGEGAPGGIPAGRYSMQHAFVASQGNRLFQIAQGSGGRRSCGAERQVAASLVVAVPKELPTTGTGSTRKGTFLFQYVMVASRPPVVARQEPRPPTKQNTQFQVSDCPALQAEQVSPGLR